MMMYSYRMVVHCVIMQSLRCRQSCRGANVCGAYILHIKSLVGFCNFVLIVNRAVPTVYVLDKNGVCTYICTYLTKYL